MSASTLLAGRYELQAPLSSGGFAETWLAIDTMTPSRRSVVVKQLKTPADDSILPVVLAAFEREAAVLEHLGQHCDRVPVLYAYFQEAGQLYLVQEYIAGQTLRQLGRQSPEQARSLLEQLLAILATIHQAGAIHRDIKPDNIILRESDSRPVLIDFGAVRQAIETASATQLRTASKVIGTPGYMAPEQAMGRVTFATDLYGLAMTIGFILTGQDPLDWPTDHQTGLIFWEALLPDLDPQLRRILERASQPQLIQRYSSVAEMQAALTASTTAIATQVVAPRQQPRKQKERKARQTPSSAPPTRSLQPVPPPLPRSDRPQQQRSLWLGIGIFLVLSLTGAVLATGLWFWQEQERTRQQALRQQFEELQANLQEARRRAEAAKAEAERAKAEAEAAKNNPLGTLAEQWFGGSNETKVPTTLTADNAIATVESLYGAIAARNWSIAQTYFAGDLAAQFDPQFFEQFREVTVENLSITRQSIDRIELIGENRYIWPDGSQQREQRSFTIAPDSDGLKLVESQFLAVLEPRR
ncbi:serine/threonine-protein kinase [Synechococcus elongatus]|uniref:non-specific serine/threonine protein kinase n=1 Tax=Synechococcus elongatus (strain ATCC 33912 / PCC 7942 / FACHB-805) TaxID=1140 RepID=Q31P78_SYNE7|nr:serine/threonine-protein kinase [Synechococcus elongatus]MBD2688679.1 serine/threonine protein kinase [Synechococcus elongatus FACHB-1061]ABB57141.1 serine/threonine protein kinase [Synechococcus elongatus PCC 7942 = FACHB-805]AJD58343.1 serine/threonine protein kinase [Synechococcus elongatus UTEX 2973]MBD2587542.1 serine/threonine protein kinase [Synechococcus elongatus FACHB-242]MBD2707750.1 serine/threonine protein kinase [Synechococcus elongatus PCC 7942 = FACHB-805]